MGKMLNQYAEDIKNLFRSMEKNFRNYMLSQISDYSFTVPQLMLLQELYHHPDITLKELSERMGLAKSTVCGIVDRLEAQGVVTRVRDVDDRRNVKISVAPKMLELKDSLNIVKTNYFAGMLQGLDQDEIEKIIQGLRKLNLLMEQEQRKE